MYKFVETRSPSSSVTAMSQLHNNRTKAAKSILDFPFNKKRTKILSEVKIFGQNNTGIVYWMSRNQRVEDNWALLYAQALAMKNSLPLHVVFCMADKFLDATFRHFKFMVDGLKEVQASCEELNINFHLLRGQAGEQIPKFVKHHKMNAVVCDFSPLKIHRAWVENVRKNLPGDVPYVQVDA
jgi:deoxyribodipyrimidine photo-lyase